MSPSTANLRLFHVGCILTPLVTLGGFCIDPCYCGRLLIGLFNLSSTPFPLIPGKKLIAASFYKLSEDEIDKTVPIPPSLNDFPDELIKVIREYEPAQIQNIADSVYELKTQLRAIQERIDSHREWREQFERFLDQHNEQIGKLSDSLDKEIESRKTGQSDMKAAINAIRGNIAFLRGAGWIISVIFGLVGALLIAWLGKQLLGV